MPSRIWHLKYKLCDKILSSIESEKGKVVQQNKQRKVYLVYVLRWRRTKDLTSGVHNEYQTYNYNIWISSFKALKPNSSRSKRKYCMLLNTHWSSVYYYDD